VLVIITCVYLLVCVDANKGGPLANCKILVYTTLPNNLQLVIKAVFGEACLRYVGRTITYLCYS